MGLGNRTDQLALLVSGKSIHLPGKVVAVGECGLDYSRKNTVGKELQKQVFTNQLKIAMQYKLPLVLHIRDAEADGYEVLAAQESPLTGRYTGTASLVDGKRPPCGWTSTEPAR